MSYESSYRLRARNGKGNLLHIWPDIEASELIENLTVKEAYAIMEAHKSGFRFDGENRKPIRNRIADFELIHPMGHKEIVTRDMINVPKSGTESAKVTADELIAQEAALDTTPPTLSTCVRADCARTLTLIHGTWIGLNGDDRCAGGYTAHMPAPDGDDELTTVTIESYVKSVADYLVAESGYTPTDAANVVALYRDTIVEGVGWHDDCLATTAGHMARRIIDMAACLESGGSESPEDLRGMPDTDPELVTVAMSPVAPDPVYLIPATERRALRSILDIPTVTVADGVATVGAYRVTGHGDRAYDLVSEEHGVTVVRPVAGGMEWTHDADQVYRADWVSPGVAVATLREKARRWDRRRKASIGRNRKGN